MPSLLVLLNDVGQITGKIVGQIVLRFSHAQDMLGLNINYLPAFIGIIRRLSEASLGLSSWPIIIISSSSGSKSRPKSSINTSFNPPIDTPTDHQSGSIFSNRFHTRSNFLISSVIIHSLLVVLRWLLLIPVLMAVVKLTVSLLTFLIYGLADVITMIRQQHPHHWQPKGRRRGQLSEMATPRVFHDAESQSSIEEAAKLNSMALTSPEQAGSEIADHLAEDSSGEIPDLYKESIGQTTESSKTLSATSLGKGWLVLMVLLLVLMTFSDLSTVNG